MVHRKMDNITFTVHYCNGPDITETTMTISEDGIETKKSRMTPIIPFKALKEIVINPLEQTRFSERSFGLWFAGNIFNFLAKHREERDQILYEILIRFPSNRTNRAHLKTIQAATRTEILILDHNPQVDAVSGAMIKHEDTKWSSNDKHDFPTDCTDASHDEHQRMIKKWATKSHQSKPRCKRDWDAAVISDATDGGKLRDKIQILRQNLDIVGQSNIGNVRECALTQLLKDWTSDLVKSSDLKEKRTKIFKRWAKQRKATSDILKRYQKARKDLTEFESHSAGSKKRHWVPMKIKKEECRHAMHQEPTKVTIKTQNPTFPSHVVTEGRNDKMDAFHDFQPLIRKHGLTEVVGTHDVLTRNHGMSEGVDTHADTRQLVLKVEEDIRHLLNREYVQPESRDTRHLLARSHEPAEVNATGYPLTRDRTQDEVSDARQILTVDGGSDGKDSAVPTKELWVELNDRLQRVDEDPMIRRHNVEMQQITKDVSAKLSGVSPSIRNWSLDNSIPVTFP